MEKLFCSVCKEESNIITHGQNEGTVFYLLSCGHKFLAKTFVEKIKMGELFGFLKRGQVNTKYTKGDDPVSNPDYARKFIRYGDTDYEAAIILFGVQNRNCDFMNQAAFLCAQSIEKYLKAFLFWNAKAHYPNKSGGEVLQKLKKLGHDLNSIVNECAKDNRDFSKFRKQIEAINKFSLLKYPDMEDRLIYSDTGLTISNDVLKSVKRIGDFIKRLI